MNKLHRKPLTEAECKERIKKWDDPEWRKRAIEGTAELIFNELFPQDNEVVAELPKGSRRRMAE